jgi:hypothetical protein
MIQTTVITDGRAIHTGPHMHRMVNQYHRDMLPYASMGLFEVFDLVKAVPFRYDPPDEEVLQRPYYTMRGMGRGGDCDDKAICLASWAKLNGIPYRFVAVRRPDRFSLHHVFTELYIEGRWVHADCTYSFNTLGCEREHYAERVVI